MKDKDFEILQAQMVDLTPAQFKALVQTYAAQSGLGAKRVWSNTVYATSEQRLTALGINRACPNCGSVAVAHYGTDSAGIQRFLCQDCGSSFTRFTGTLLERSRFPWEVWVEVLRMTLNYDSLKDMKVRLESDFGCEGINLKTIFFMRLKLIYALSAVEPPILTGVIQADETVIHESQKGSRELVSYIKGVERKPRYGRRPSKYGSMSNEFATVLTFVDSRGYCACKVTSLGWASVDNVLDLYEERCSDVAYLCSDGNNIYSRACDLLNVQHYIRPAEYMTAIKGGGYRYADEVPDWDPADLREHNRRVLAKLYREGKIDRIEFREDLTYNDFKAIKDSYRLSLARVNELHAEIKLMVEKKMTNVSTKYLQAYMDFFAFRRNWRVSKGHAPTSTKDAEKILCQILPLKVNLTREQLEQTELTLPKRSGRAMQILKEKTEKAREVTKNKYLKFHPEDLPSFNTREILLDAPRSHLNKIAKEHKIKGYTSMGRWALVLEIARLPDIEEIVIDLVTKNRAYEIDEEDILYLKSLRFVRKD